jgi:sugar phosphate isomerase/epimerase
MPLSRDDLVLCAGTLASTPLLERASAAADAGFQALSLFLDDLTRARAEGHSDVDVRSALADHGLAVAELDPLLDWASAAEADPRATARGEGFLAYGEADFYAAAEAVGARSINAPLFAPKPIPEERLVECFAGLCDRAAEHGLLVHVEFMPFSQIRDIDTALRIVEGADRPNGGLMFDVWHHFRGGGSNDTLRRAAPRVFATQLDDAPTEPRGTLFEETLHHRLFPGEGDADVAGLIRILDAGGCSAPIGVEVFCDEVADDSAAAIALRAARTTRRVLAEARGSGT